MQIKTYLFLYTFQTSQLIALFQEFNIPQRVSLCERETEEGGRERGGMFAHIFMGLPCLESAGRVCKQRLSLQFKSTGSMESDSPFPTAMENSSLFS